MKLKWAVLLISGTISSVAFSGENKVCSYFPGSYICEHGKVDNISGTYGSVALDDVVLTGIVKGNIGLIDINKSKVNQINGNIGSVIGLDSEMGKIEGNIGSMEFKKSILNEINAHTPDVRLNHSKAKKIIVSSNEKKIKVNLNNKSMVNGDVYFTGNFGVVCIDHSSELKGRVINGKIIKESC